jgi:lipopolysaccharide export LptBFGC system permease protein LptF
VVFSLPLALPLAIATAILVIIGTMNQDGELRALAAGGVSHHAVSKRLIPLVLAGVVLCMVLTQVLLPLAVADIRANRAHLLQTAIAQRVANDEPIIDQGNRRIWVGAVVGSRLEDVHGMVIQNGDITALFAPHAHWTTSADGIVLEFDDVVMLQRKADGQTISVQTQRYDYVLENDSHSLGQSEPDALSTPEVWRLASHPPGPGVDCSPYNNARLTLQVRFFLPLAIIAYALLAAGLGMTFGTAQNLVGVVIVVVTVALFTYPAIGYVKTNVHHPQINPGWLLWPPAIMLAGFGAWLMARPDLAREQLLRPLQALRAGRGT